MSWLILRIFRGDAFTIARDIEHLGIESYCPRFTTTKRLRKWREVEVTRPLFPGYLFTAEAFDTDRLNLGHIRTKFMCRDGHFIVLSPREYENVRLAEQIAPTLMRPILNEVVRKLSQPWLEKIPKNFAKLGELQKAVAA